MVARILYLLRYCGLLEPPPPPLQPHSHRVLEKDWQNALLATGVGMIAGFVANGLIMAVSQFGVGDLLRGMWHTAIALLLGSSTFLRLRSHFALDRPIHYDLWFLVFDVLLICAASVTLGVIASPHFPSRAFWIGSELVALAIFLRRARLSGKHGYQLPSGQRLLLLGMLAAGIVAILDPVSRRSAWVMVVLVIVAVVIAFLLETRNKTVGNPLLEGPA